MSSFLLFPSSALGFFSFPVDDAIADFSYIAAENICPRCYRASWKTGCRAPFSGISVSRIREKSYLRDTTLLKSRPGQTGNFRQLLPRRHESTKSRSIDKNRPSLPTVSAFTTLRDVLDLAASTATMSLSHSWRKVALERNAVVQHLLSSPLWRLGRPQPR